MKWTWWKIGTIIILSYVIIQAFLVEVPRQPIINETIRNLFFHVCMWFAMFILATFSLVHSILNLNNNSLKHDRKAVSFASVAFMFGILGLVTGMVWVNYSWNTNPNKIVLWVVEDIKLNAAAMGTLIYTGYFILRQSVDDEQKKARLSAIYNIFAFVMLLLFTTVIPRMASSSLHPGNAGNPGFNSYDVSKTMQYVFYPAILGWSMLGYWIASLKFRYLTIKNNL